MTKTLRGEELLRPSELVSICILCDCLAMTKALRVRGKLQSSGVSSLRGLPVRMQDFLFVDGKPKQTKTNTGKFQIPGEFRLLRPSELVSICILCDCLAMAKIPEMRNYSPASQALRHCEAVDLSSFIYIARQAEAI